MSDRTWGRRRWRHWTLASLMLGIALLALPLAGVRWWLDLPPCASHASGPVALAAWARGDCTTCHAGPVDPIALVVTRPAANVASAPFEPVGHATTLDRSTCTQCHAAAP